MALIASVAAGSPDGNGFDTATINTTGANLIIICAAYASEPTIVDSNSNTYTPLTAHGGGTPSQRMYYCFNPTVGAGHLFSANGAGHNASITVLAFSGALSAPFDQQNGATGSGVSSQATGSITPTQDNEYVIATVALEGSGVTATIDSSMALGPAITASAAPHKGVAVGWKQQSTAGAINPTFTLSGSSNTAAAIASFKASAPAAPPATLLDWPNPQRGPQPSPQRFSEEQGRNQALFFVPPPPLPAGKSILFPNPTLRRSYEGWRWSHTNDTPLGLYAPYFPAPTDVVFTINGVDATPYVNKSSIEINTYINEQPNTCTFKINGLQPIVGQIVVIGLGSTDPNSLIFAGTIVTTKQSYDGAPAQGPNNITWLCDCLDFTFLLNRRRPIGTFTNVSASTVFMNLIANFSSGFDSFGVPLGLPTISIAFDGSKTFAQCLTDICNLISYNWKVSYVRSLQVFTVLPGASPTIIDASNTTTQVDPVMEYEIDLTQIRTQVIGKGPFQNLLSDILDNETIVPVGDVGLFGATGGAAFVGPANEITYAGTYAPAVTGSVVGPGGGPSTAPALAPAAGTELGLGNYEYDYTFVTPSGESLPSPLGFVTTAVLAAPSTQPQISSSGSGGNIDYGDIDYESTFVTSGGETTGSPASASYTVFTFTDPGAIGPVSVVDNATGWVPVGIHGRAAGTAIDIAIFYTGGPNKSNVGTAIITHTVKAQGGGVATLDIVVPGTNQAHVSVIWAAIRLSGAGNVWYDGQSGGFNPGGGSNVTIASCFPGPTEIIFDGPITCRNVSVFLPFSTDPNVTARKLYRRFNGAGTYKLVGTIADNVTANLTDNLANSSLGADIPLVSTATNQRVNVTGIAAGPTPTSSRKLYRTTVGGTQPKLVTTIADNVTTSYLDLITDGSLGANAPTGDTSGLQIPVVNGAGFYTDSSVVFPTNGAATVATSVSPVFTSASYTFVSSDVGAQIYIKSGTNWISGKYTIASVAAGAATLTGACATVASPTAATWGIDYSILTNARIAFTDMAIDASNSAKFTSAAHPVGVNFIGNVIAISNSIGFFLQRVIVLSTSGTVGTCDKSLGTLSSTGGIGNLGGAPPATSASAGSSSIVVSSTAPYSATGGWASLAGIYIRYTGLSSTSLTGIPTSGVGSLSLTVSYGTLISGVSALTGCSSVLAAVAGVNVYTAVVINDSAAQALLVALEGGDGIHQYMFTDSTVPTLAALIAEAQSIVDQFGEVLVTLVEGARDINTVSGRQVTVNLASPFNIAVTLLIQSVKITHIGTERGAYPLFTATASSVKYTLQDLIRQLGNLTTQQ